MARISETGTLLGHLQKARNGLDLPSRSVCILPWAHSLYTALQSCRNVKYYQHDYSPTNVETMAPPTLCPLCHMRTISCACGTNKLLTRPQNHSKNQGQTLKNKRKEQFRLLFHSTGLAKKQNKKQKTNSAQMALTGKKRSRANHQNFAHQYWQWQPVSLHLVIRENLKYSCASLLYHTAYDRQAMLREGRATAWGRSAKTATEWGRQQSRFFTV